MSYTPLIPLPSDQASTQTPDPFEELFREPISRLSDPPPNRPLFPQKISNTSPIRIPSVRSHSILITPPSSTESEFGAFVCVPPTQDPLTSPQFSHSPKTSKTALSEIAFVDEARRRTNISENRLVGEILTAEKEQEHRWRAAQTQKPTHSEYPGEFQTADVRNNEEVTNFLSQGPKGTNLKDLDNLTILSSSAPRPGLVPSFVEEHSPGMASKRSSSSSALYQMNGSTPFKSALSGRLVQTLPKKWST